TCESQVFSAMIMGVTYALYEEKVMDAQTGRMLNPNMEFYRLAGLADIGNFKVHMMTGKGYDERGRIGVGEPPNRLPRRGDLERGGQRHRRPRAHTPVDSRPRARGARKERRGQCKSLSTPARQPKSRPSPCSALPGARPKSSPAGSTCSR